MSVSKHVDKYLKIHAQSAQVVKTKVVDLVESFRMVVSRPLYDQIRPQLGHFYVLRVSFLTTTFLIAMGGVYLFIEICRISMISTSNRNQRIKEHILNWSTACFKL